MPRQPYPSDVTDEAWHFVLPYLTLMRPDAPQRHHDLRELFNALRWIVRTGAQWAYLPHEFPVWTAVYQQTRRWLAAGVFEAMNHDLRAILRVAAGRAPVPTAVIVDSRTLQSTPMSGERAAYDGAKRKRGSKVHIAVDTLGHLLALRVTPADAQDRAQVAVVDVADRAPGPTADSALVARSGLLGRLPPGVGARGDLGDPGLGMLHPLGASPRRTPRGRDRPPADVADNRACARRRIAVEHTIGQVRR